MKKNLILTGMMGVGKSTVGRSLSKRLNMKFIDIDEIIEKDENMSINEIFKNKGEAHFRNLEKIATLKKLEEMNSVIALGGGAFTNPTIRDVVLKNCISFWLNLNIELLSKRLIKSNKRPLFNETMPEDSLSKIFDKRKKVYKLANYEMDCNKDDTPTLVEKIAKIYESKSN